MKINGLPLPEVTWAKEIGCRLETKILLLASHTWKARGIRHGVTTPGTGRGVLRLGIMSFSGCKKNQMMLTVI